MLFAIIIHILSIIEINSLYQEEMMKQHRLPDKWIVGMTIREGDDCHIFVPPITDEETLNIYLHEMRHCSEGSWHK